MTAANMSDGLIAAIAVGGTSFMRGRGTCYGAQQGDAASSSGDGGGDRGDADMLADDDNKRTLAPGSRKGTQMSQQPSLLCREEAFPFAYEFAGEQMSSEFESSQHVPTDG
eukprot:760520-Hanusia_phi.AAC.7